MKPTGGAFRSVCALAVFAAMRVCAADCATGDLPEVWTDKMPEEWKKIDISVKSTLDGSMQPASFLFPAKARACGSKVPMLVTLHSWSYGYEFKNPATWAANECTRRGWAMLYPHFRGPNKTPQACGSDLAVQDIADQIKWAIANYPVDAERVYILGGSGGGHMALLMAGRHPGLFAGVYAACPISDIARWYCESMDPVKKLYPSYGKMILAACGGKPDEKAEEYRRRSPLTWLPFARKANVPVSITTGIHDGHARKGGGSVPVGHSIRAYNELVPQAERISEETIAEIERTEKIPPALMFGGNAPYFKEGKVFLRLTSGNARLTIFDAGHAGNYTEGIEWLSLQRRGKPADWNVRLQGGAKTSSDTVTK